MALSTAESENLPTNNAATARQPTGAANTTPRPSLGRAGRVIGESLGIAVTGVLMAWSWIHAEAFATCWLGLMGFFLLTTRFAPKWALLLGGLTGGLALGIAFHWAPPTIAGTLGQPVLVGWAVFLLLVLWESVPFAVVAWAGARQLKISLSRAWVIPALWVAVEYYWPKVFPWTMAYSQTQFLDLIQIADLGGAGAVSFCLIAAAIIPAAVLLSATAPDCATSKRTVAVYTLLVSGLIVAVIGYGRNRREYWQQHVKHDKPLQLGLVQVDPGYVDSVAKMQKLTDSLQDDVDLVCWPESTLGNYSLSLTNLRSATNLFQDSFPPVVDLQPLERLKCHLLAGGKSFPSGATEYGPFYQTAYLLSPDQAVLGRYQKRDLLPIGEYVPGQNYFPFLKDLADLEDTLYRGEDPAPLELAGGGKIGIVICYEDTVPRNARETVNAGAEALICLTNASDFESPLALEQHMRLALFRAVENRRYFARCTATGLSCVISPTGEMLQRLEAGKEGTLQATIALIEDPTWYNQIGFRLPAFALVLTLAGLTWPGRSSLLFRQIGGREALRSCLAGVARR